MCSSKSICWKACSKGSKVSESEQDLASELDYACFEKRLDVMP